MLPSSGTAFAIEWAMPQRTLASRVDAIEEKVKKFDRFLDNFDTTLEKRFRAQGEMLDERFAEVNQNVAVVRSDISALQRDMTIVREGIKIILGKLR